MPIRHKIIPSAKIAYAKAWGTLALEEILREGNNLFSDEGWEDGFDVILDYREAVKMDLNMEDVRQIVRQDKVNNTHLKGCRCAVVANGDHAYGLSRMWQMMSDGETNVDAMVFRDISQALDWLGLAPEILDSLDSQP